MYKLIGPPGTYKTTSLIPMAINENATVICENPEELMEYARQLGMIGVKAIDYKTAQFLPASIHDNYVVDNLDKFVNQVLGINKTLVGFTIDTGE